jgi:hypothetical protein
MLGIYRVAAHLVAYWVALSYTEFYIYIYIYIYIYYLSFSLTHFLKLGTVWYKLQWSTSWRTWFRPPAQATHSSLPQLSDRPWFQPCIHLSHDCRLFSCRFLQLLSLSWQNRLVIPTSPGLSSWRVSSATWQCWIWDIYLSKGYYYNGALHTNQHKLLLANYTSFHSLMTKQWDVTDYSYSWVSLIFKQWQCFGQWGPKLLLTMQIITQLQFSEWYILKTFKTLMNIWMK